MLKENDPAAQSPPNSKLSKDEDAQASKSRLAGKPDDRQAWLTFAGARSAELDALGSEESQLSALCLSGGGIRSATFALGALQGLADAGILEHFDYLSTVSGGGYIGSWLTAWKQRWCGLTAAQAGSAATTVISQLKTSGSPPAGEIDPIQHLREYNNYLSPKLGFFSVDTWTLAATVARNMLLNWMVFIPILLAALALPRIVLSIARLGDTVTLWYVPWVGQKFGDLRVIVPVLGAACFGIGVLNVLRYLPGVGGVNHTQGQFLKFCFAPFYLAALALLTIDAWFTGGDKNVLTTLTFWELFLWVVIPGAAGYSLFAVFCWRRVAARLEKLSQSARPWSKLKWVVGLLAAAALTTFSTTGGAWLLLYGPFRYLSWPVYVTVAMPLLVLSFALAITVFVGFSSRVLEDDDREWLARAGAWGLLCIVGWAGLCVVALLAPQILIHPEKSFQWLDSGFAAVGGLSGLAAVLAGLSSQARGQTAGNETDDKSGGFLEIVGKIAAPLFTVVFLTYLAILTNWIFSATGLVGGDWKNHRAFLENTRTEVGVLFAAICLLFSWIMAKFIDINKFSLQAMYRNRLIRAYLGASNDKAERNKFIGFEETDNLLIKDLGKRLKPFHILNLTLNLVAGERLAWQQRKAESFTVSALHCGSENLGYRPAKEYGGPKGVSLGTAMAISGAAASPNMGYHSAPALAFIMTLFNARLGAWLGNPAKQQTHWRDEGPRSAFNSIIREAFGLTNDTSPYVYLSDGGHFENLGLYEMVRRRCRYIILLDAAADPEFAYNDLGNALRKIRIDMKIPIEFEEPLPAPGVKPNARCALATIDYKATGEKRENGWLIYIKPVILGSEPPDVTAYKTAHPTFPHESTADQWFDESQTESYRMLGLLSIADVFRNTAWNPNKEFYDVVEHVKAYLKPMAAKAAGAGHS